MKTREARKAIREAEEKLRAIKAELKKLQERQRVRLYEVISIEPYRDYVLVRATNKERARRLAIRFWRHENKRKKSNIYLSVLPHRNPMRGLAAHDVTDVWFRCSCGLKRRHRKTARCPNPTWPIRRNF